MSDVLEAALAAIAEPDAAAGQEVQRRLDEKTKPRGSLGGLERLAVQIASIQRIPFSHHARMSNDVLKFTNVARPGVPAQHHLGAAGNSSNRPVIAGGKLLYEVTLQKW